ncbi:hypothetical protein CSA56_13955 [candidate division KSB3 bacterium]|uniref:Uncharacterized protein n=1 Tax=candidate division KSB3 bacterium TaxID=2044937 RepID=A0A2G6KAR0_9BACT|nr:MAG: hypothetical protein CSA56_13955 [candidate division KSB3 bacterium]
MLNFRECTLVTLEKTFHIQQVRTHSVLENWLDGQADLSDFDKQVVLTLQEKLILNVYDWNETELAYNFIGPLLAFVNYTTEQYNFFAERPFSGIVEGIEVGGKADGMIASGFREPEQPYFCLHEYKKEKDPDGDPAAQALAAMLVAQEMNEGHCPVYGCYVKGRDWFFMLLQGKEYAISQPYIATRDDVFDIFRIMKVLKQLITQMVDKEHRSEIGSHTFC